MNKIHDIAAAVLFIIGIALYLVIYGQDKEKKA